MKQFVNCVKKYSYKTSITNLKRHLQAKHISAYTNLLDTSSSTARRPVQNEELRPPVAEQNLEDASAVITALARQRTEDSLAPAVTDPSTSSASPLHRVTKRQRPITVYVPRKLNWREKKILTKNWLK